MKMHLLTAGLLAPTLLWSGPAAAANQAPEVEDLPEITISDPIEICSESDCRTRSATGIW